MGLLSIFKRRDDTRSQAVPVTETADAVQRARTRARQRLIGAAVLVVIGIVGFPLVFETQPRPIPVDIPIELPRREGATPLVMPAPRAPNATPTASAVSPAPAPAPTRSGSSAIDVITESREDAGREVTGGSAAAPPASSAPSAAKPDVKTTPKPAEVASEETPKRAEPKPVTSKPPTADAARARALLEGKPSTPASESGRFVVQVGAFADPGAARETRLKVEKLGLKTYTQVASTPAGNRIRVRAGPFSTRDEADKAMAKARSAGLSAVVLTL